MVKKYAAYTIVITCNDTVNTSDIIKTIRSYDLPIDMYKYNKYRSIPSTGTTLNLYSKLLVILKHSYEIILSDININNHLIKLHFKSTHGELLDV